MAQQQLPLFPVGSTGVTQGQAFEKRDGRVTYFYGTLKVFSHDENDLASLQLIPTQHPVLYQWLCQTNGYRPCFRCFRKGGVSKDHVHMHIEYPAKLSVSDFVKRVKGRTSRRFQEEFPQLKKRYWGRHFWAIGYGAWSTGNITDEIVQEYFEHHRAG